MFVEEVAPKEEKLHFTTKDKLKSIVNLGPLVLLIASIMIAMYGGFATPTEAAAVGVLGSLIIGYFQKCLSIKAIKDALMATTRTASMIGLIIIGAVFLSQIMGFLGIPVTLANKIGALGLSPLALVSLLMLFYIFLGCIMEGMAILVMTLPITLPLVLEAGYSKIWYGIFMVIAIQIAQITPPVGFNLFLIQGMTGDNLKSVSKSVIPFLIILVIFSIFIAIYPKFIDFLPNYIVFRG